PAPPCAFAVLLPEAAGLALRGQRAIETRVEDEDAEAHRAHRGERDVRATRSRVRVAPALRVDEADGPAPLVGDDAGHALDPLLGLDAEPHPRPLLRHRRHAPSWQPNERPGRRFYRRRRHPFLPRGGACAAVDAGGDIGNDLEDLFRRLAYSPAGAGSADVRRTTTRPPKRASTSP